MLICQHVLTRIFIDAGFPALWQEIDVPSKTDTGKVYVVAYSPHGKGKSTCSCEGFEYRSYCSHIKEAHRIINCEWTSNAKEAPTLDGTCPWCAGEVVEVEPRK